MVSLNRRLYTQADYDCQVCGRPETEAMKKRAGDFVRPTCDECVAQLAHDGHHRPDLVANCSSVVITVDPASGQRVEHRKDWTIPYREWDGRCRRCFP